MLKKQIRIAGEKKKKKNGVWVLQLAKHFSEVPLKVYSRGKGDMWAPLYNIITMPNQ